MSFEIKFKFLDSALRSAKVPNEKTPENNSHQQNKLFRKRLFFKAFFMSLKKYKSLWLKKLSGISTTSDFLDRRKKWIFAWHDSRIKLRVFQICLIFYYAHVYSIAYCEGQNFLRPSFRPTSSKSSADSSDSESIKILQRLTVGECHKVLTLRQMLMLLF